MSDYDRFCEHGTYLGRNCEHCESQLSAARNHAKRLQEARDARDAWKSLCREQTLEIERLQSLLEAANEMEADREAALQEIERLTACVEHHQAVEADQERAIERLQSELGVWKSNAETNLGEVERLREELDDWDLIRCDVCDGHFETVRVVGNHLQCDRCSENERMRSALERILA